ncbi:MAG TPA: ABATE domain-containing protein [Candidatus Acidoferrales bacterium]|nr:ABATE domain-containing protein [Candidatus Acidoferrales bacterium]
MPRVAGEARPLDAVRFDGGRRCLDFVNTIHDRSAAVPEDYFCTPARYLGWCVRAGLLSKRQAARVRADERTSVEVRALRAALHAIFSARIDGRPARPIDADCFDAWLHRAWARRAFDPAAPELLGWRPDTPDAKRPLEQLALESLELLQTADPRRLRRCAAAEGCGWLFYDETRSGSRRWCSMETCGTLEKMRRYRRGQS